MPSHVSVSLPLPSLALVDDPLFYEHRAPAGHPERPERLDAARAAIAKANVSFSRLELAPRDASDEELCRVHSPAYINKLGHSAGKSGYFDADTYYGPASVSAARRAAGGAIALTDALFNHEARFGVALLRPPGHHARPDTAMGFCLLNNVAVAAAHARSLGAQRVMIVDWDVHHGNGTQEIFYADPSVLYVSLHQFPFYPGTGDVTELGAAEGTGYTVNVPLRAGATDATYLAAFDRIITPITEQYAPDVLLISAGFDAHRRDPLAQMSVTEDGYAQMTRRLLASIRTDTSVGVLLEGGYDLIGLGDSLQATIEALDDHASHEAASSGGSRLTSWSEEDLARATETLKAHWRL
jgi:acetoin utilization deacetylase AcuC-like enzyme